MSIARPKKPSEIRFYDILVDGLGYRSWIPGFKKLQTTKAEFAELDKEHLRFRQMSLDLETLGKKYDDSYTKMHERFVYRLSQMMLNNQTSDDPLGRYERLPADRYYLGNYFPASCLEDALELIAAEKGDDFGIDSNVRQEKLTELEALMAAKKAEISRLSPAEYFPVIRGSVSGDIRKSFMRNWVTDQKGFNAGISPLLVSMSSPDVDPDEKWAYEQLQISKFINTKVSRMPAPSVDYAP